MRDHPLARRLAPLGLVLLASCGSEAVERSREVVDEQIDQARDRLADAGAEFERTGREGLRQASEGLDQWLAQGRETIGSAATPPQPITGAAEAIHCAAATRCTISAAFIDRLARDPMVLSGEAVALPAQGNSELGLALSSVRAGSIPSLLGLREGDVLISLNGTNLASLAAPRALADALSGTDEATLIYERGGQRRTLKIVRVAS